jgi:hypothetical protein
MSYLSSIHEHVSEKKKMLTCWLHLITSPYNVPVLRHRSAVTSSLRQHRRQPVTKRDHFTIIPTYNLSFTKTGLNSARFTSCTPPEGWLQQTSWTLNYQPAQHSGQVKGKKYLWQWLLKFKSGVDYYVYSSSRWYNLYRLQNYCITFRHIK